MGVLTSSCHHPAPTAGRFQGLQSWSWKSELSGWRAGFSWAAPWPADGVFSPVFPPCTAVSQSFLTRTPVMLGQGPP